MKSTTIAIIQECRKKKKKYEIGKTHTRIEIQQNERKLQKKAPIFMFARECVCVCVHIIFFPFSLLLIVFVTELVIPYKQTERKKSELK